ncbi:DNA-binding transcriptional regulator, MarR family [Ferrithrix thermotolerans DSM 19514]|jgi:DNA-binding MarR family transcriptional regulator|uniref:DNA-binding transcriptional regulator, MarR family n=1 Tax=Ferrithrix thermotolerans DSM 19514 TaxID=1121881 RepID=A0A1M4XD07_9ACTN|nr:MarR family transcriptional regulator [Ferrithrix thermotolerans]SHE91283.1 DNA-binding transcriptional regulator, MarR family [Ferrithrix thermotolerans DSM 19514]
MTERRDTDAIAEARRQWNKRWPDAASAMATATSIMRAQQIVLKAVDDSLRPLGLTFARFEALTLLSFTKTGALPLGKLGKLLMIHPTSVTNIVDRLSDDGYIERVPHPSDRRTTLARITNEGRSLAKKAADVVNAIGFGLDALSESEKEAIVQIVRRLRVSTGELS